MNGSVIQCNTTMQVIGRISVESAIVSLIDGSAVAIENKENEYVRSPSLTIPVPKIIALSKYAKVPATDKDGDQPLRGRYHSKKVILNRDNHTCCYCGEYGDTVDHVIPKKSGGLSTWDNLVTCCTDCNSEKAHTTLVELGWDMLYSPSIPLRKHLSGAQSLRKRNDQDTVNKALAAMM